MARGDLGVYIKERRNQLGMRQVDLSEAIFASDRTYITQVELGRIGLPGHDMRQKIARALHVREVDLLVAAGELDRADLDISDRVASLAERVNALSPEHYEILVALLDQFLLVQRRGGLGGGAGGGGEEEAGEGGEVDPSRDGGAGEAFGGMEDGTAVVADLDADLIGPEWAGKGDKVTDRILATVD